MINFVLDKSQNYQAVQSDLLDIIGSYISPQSRSSSLGKKRASALNFSLFVRRPADVLMSHGVADKNYFTDIRDDNGDLYINRLDALLVPGEWMKRKLLAHPDVRLTGDQIHCVGWPRLDRLRTLGQSPQAHLSGHRRKRVLWAPTHDHAKKGEDQISTSSFPEFAQYLPTLEQYADVSASLHPRNRSSKAPTYQELIDADVVISDFGTVVYEAWALGKPVIFPSWINGSLIREYLPSSAEAHIYTEGIGHHASSLDEILEWLQEELHVDENVDRFMEDYLLNYRHGLSGLKVAQVLTAMEPAYEPAPAVEVPLTGTEHASGFEMFLEALHAQTPERP